MFNHLLNELLVSSLFSLFDNPKITTLDLVMFVSSFKGANILPKFRFIFGTKEYIPVKEFTKVL